MNVNIADVCVHFPYAVCMYTLHTVKQLGLDFLTRFLGSFIVSCHFGLLSTVYISDRGKG